MPDLLADRESRRRPQWIVPMRPPPNEVPRADLTKAASLPYLLTVDEVAELLRTTRKAIYCKIQRGLLPSIVRDGRRRSR